MQTGDQPYSDPSPYGEGLLEQSWEQLLSWYF